MIFAIYLFHMLEYVGIRGLSYSLSVRYLCNGAILFSTQRCSSVDLLLVLPSLISCSWWGLRLSRVWHGTVSPSVRGATNGWHSGVAKMSCVSSHLSVILLLTTHVIILISIVVFSGESSLNSFVHGGTLQPLFWYGAMTIRGATSLRQ